MIQALVVILRLVFLTIQYYLVLQALKFQQELQDKDLQVLMVKLDTIQLPTYLNSMKMEFGKTTAQAMDQLLA